MVSKASFMMSFNAKTDFLALSCAIWNIFCSAWSMKSSAESTPSYPAVAMSVARIVKSKSIIRRMISPATHIFCRVHAFVPGCSDVGRGGDHSSDDGLALDYPGVIHDVGRGGDSLDQVHDVGNTANRCQLVGTPEKVRKRDHIYGGGPVEELYHPLEYLGVSVVVKVAPVRGKGFEHLVYGVFFN